MKTRSRGRWFVCALLLPILGAEPRLQSPSLDAQLLAAAGRGDAARVADLLAKGADVNAPDSGRASTPLYIASEQGHVEVVRILLDHGADPNTKDLEWGRTPLKNASVPPSDEPTRKAFAEIIRLLLDRGAGTEGESLVDLIRRGHIEAARTIVSRGGVDPSYLNLALQAARRAQQTALAELLIRAGAKEPGPADSGSGRVRLLAGIYRSQAGQELKLRPSLNYEDQAMLERAGRARVGLLPMDLLTLRSFDRKVVIGWKAGPMPPREVTLREGGRSEVFVRTAEAMTQTRATETTPQTRPARMDRAVSPISSFPPAARARDWPSFRGAGGSGVADGVPLPTVWNVEKGINIRWKTPIPGLAHSSPVVWGDRVFVTTAVPHSDTKLLFVAGPEANSTAASANRSTRDDVAHSWRVYALDKPSGRILWERMAHEGIPQTARHANESQANSTPATDGRHLVVFFGSEGLYCYDLNGKLLWKKDLGPLNSGYLVDPSDEWNTASSPIIYKNLVILQIDLLKNSFIAAFDIETGRQVWHTERDEAPSWPTPLLYEGPPRTELVTLAPNFARGYDPDTGKELWRLGKHSTYATPTPIAGLGLIFLTSGSGNTVQPIYAIRPGATGDITLGDDEASNDYVAWSKHRGGSFLATPILYGDLLYVCTDTGILSAYKAETGERTYQVRLPLAGGANNYTASPVAADGKIYFPNADGDVVVVKAGPKFEQLAVNPMGEVILASPAISEDMIIFRMQHHVIAVAEPRSRQ